MPWYMRQLLARGYWDKAEDDTGSGSGGGGDGGGDGKKSDADDGSKDDDSTSDDGDDGDKKGDDKGDKKPSKTTDAEAKLLKEVMEKKKALKKTEEQLAQVNARLKEFEGLDPAAMKKLLKEQEDAERARLEAQGNFEAVKKQMNDAHAKELKAKDDALKTVSEEVTSLKNQIANLTVGNAFAQSRFITEEMVLTPSKARIVYGSHFEFDGERVVGYDKPAGAKDRSPLVDSRGDPMSFEAALRALVEADPDRDQVLKSKMRNGAGSNTTRDSGRPNDRPPLTSADKIREGLKAKGIVT